MSNQSAVNTRQSYFLPAQGLDQAFFNKLSGPPLAIVNKGVLYELVDGNLYYNGSIIQTMANSSNYDPTTMNVSANGVTGASGFINNPLPTVTDALANYDFNGFTIQLVGQSTETIQLPPNCIINGNSSLSFRSALGDINIDNTSTLWSDPAPFGLNQSFLNDCSLQGLVTYNTQVLSLLVLNDSIIQGGLNSFDVDCNQLLFLKNCVVASPLDIRNTNLQFSGLVGLFNFLPGDITLTHDSSINDMTANIFSATVNYGSNLNINAQSSTNVMNVNLVGANFFNLITIDVPTGGALNLAIDDTASIFFTPGSQANTNLSYIKQSLNTGYTPTVPGDWSVPPTQVSDALDELAAVTATSITMPGTTQNNEMALYSSAAKTFINSGVLVEHDDPDKMLTINDLTINAATKSDSVSFGLSNMFSASSVANTVCVGTRNMSYLDQISNCIVIGDAALAYQGAVGQNASGLILIGGTWGANGAYVSAGVNNVNIGNGNGYFATSANNNVCVGHNTASALSSGVNNLCLGNGSGSVQDTGSNNIYILTTGAVASESNVTRIGSAQTKNFQAGIYNITDDDASARYVTINSTGQLCATYPAAMNSAQIYFTDFTTPYNKGLTMNTPVHLTPSTLYTGNVIFSSPSNGIIQYDGSKTQLATITLGIEFLPSLGVIDYEVSIYTGAFPLVAGTKRITVGTTYVPLTINSTTIVSTGSQYSCYVTNLTDNSAIDVAYFNILMSV